MAPDSNAVGNKEIPDYSIAHLFADYGVECEVLGRLGTVSRYTIDPNQSEFDDDTIQMDLMEETPDESFDLAILHPKCTDKSPMTNISGDTEDHANQIPRAREIAIEIADDYVIENKPRDDLNNPVVLNGDMFGLPIKYERAFETSFPVSSPPRERQLGEKTVTPYYYSDRSVAWWKTVKGYSGDYPKQHLAKNAIPAIYMETITRSWLETQGRNRESPQDNNGRPPRKIANGQETLVGNQY